MNKPHVDVGRCIYCDSTTGLTREHVLPQGLGGRQAPFGDHEALVLRNASCSDCSAITHAIEGECLGKMMGHFRAATGFVRKDRAKATVPIEIIDPANNRRRQHVPVNEVPANLLLPSFGEPGILSQKDRIGTSYRIGLRLISPGPLQHPVPGQDGEHFATAGMGPQRFGQMLAKIGLAFAVWHFGIDGFEPLVRDFIRSDNKPPIPEREVFGYWVGGPGADAPPPPPTDNLHRLELFPISLGDGREYVAAGIQLFANLGGPPNYVIVGIKPSAPEE